MPPCDVADGRSQQSGADEIGPEQATRQPPGHDAHEIARGQKCSAAKIARATASKTGPSVRILEALEAAANRVRTRNSPETRAAIPAPIIPSDSMDIDVSCYRGPAKADHGYPCGSLRLRPIVLEKYYRDLVCVDRTNLTIRTGKVASWKTRARAGLEMARTTLSSFRVASSRTVVRIDH